MSFKVRQPGCHSTDAGVSAGSKMGTQASKQAGGLKEGDASMPTAAAETHAPIGRAGMKCLMCQPSPDRQMILKPQLLNTLVKFT